MIKRISIFRKKQDLWRSAAAVIRRLAGESVREHGCFTLVLSGGKTPETLYSLLAGDEDAGNAHGEDAGEESGEASTTEIPGGIPWDKVLVFWGDERFVPHDHPDSNCGMARRALLSRIAVPEGNVFPVPTGAGTPERAAALYEETIRSEKRLKREGDAPSAPPSFDLILLGMGKDGHTASLYPESGALGERQRLVCAAEAPGTEAPRMEAPGNGPRHAPPGIGGTPTARRITMTLPLINNALNSLFLVTGDDKKETLARVLSEEAKSALEGRGSSCPEGGLLPAQLVRPRRALYFFTDVSLWQI
jgi:6-phosphogluconolactonase